MKNGEVIDFLKKRISELEDQNRVLLDIVKNLTAYNPPLKPGETLDPPKFVDMLGQVETMETKTEQDKIDKKIAMEQILGIMNH